MYIHIYIYIYIYIYIQYIYIYIYTHVSRRPGTLQDALELEPREGDVPRESIEVSI